jgi:hypothetical protein
MSTKKTKAPSAGEALVASILADLAEQDMAPDSRETELLKRASAAADKLERLEAALAETGLTYTDKEDVTRPSPLLAEIRSTTLVLTRCLGGIQMDPGKESKNPSKVRAGQASWQARSAGGDLRGAIARG